MALSVLENQYELDLAREISAKEDVLLFAAALAQVAGPVWHWGDGDGGWVYLEIETALAAVGLRRPARQPGPPKRPPISRGLSRRVWNRDDWTCVRCGDHRDLTVDHVIPVSKGGGNDFDNLQTMCRSCNCSKGNRE